MWKKMIRKFRPRREPEQNSAAGAGPSGTTTALSPCREEFSLLVDPLGDACQSPSVAESSLLDRPRTSAHIPRQVLKMNSWKAESILSDEFLRQLSSEIGLGWGELGTNLGFSNAALQGFSHDYQSYGIKEVIFQMLITWRHRQANLKDAQVKLEETFARNKRLDLVRLLRGTDATNPTRGQPSPGDSCANICEQELNQIYTQRYGFVQSNPFDYDPKHCTDIFTKLELEGDNKQSILTGEIFTQKSNEGDAVNRVVLKGLAGKGKTTLIANMAYNMARKEALGQFKVVFVLMMSVLFGSYYNSLLPL